jgi:hypothetical protein
MSRQMKYIVMERDCEPRIFIFQESIEHVNMATVLHRFGKPVRAGFVYMTSEGIYCYGKSESLRLVSDSKEDTAMLNKQLGQQD